MTAQQDIVGPVLTLDDIRDGALHLAALFITSGVTPPPVSVQGVEAPVVPLGQFGGDHVWRARFRVPADAQASYVWDGTEYALASDLTGDLSIAFVSCNGEEHGDLDRDPEERNRMWRRLARQHDAAPLSLLLHGGDQIYADEATDGHPLTEDWPARIPENPGPVALADLRRHLRARFAERYRRLYADPDFAHVAARVPSLMQWDDHDICDGWGSLPRRATSSAVGQVLFAVAREAALAFQHACAEDDLPARFADPAAAHLGWRVEAQGLRLLAPDLRSRRGRRKVMEEDGWAMIEQAAATPTTGRTLILSSVPLLGPRLSLLETLMVIVPGMQKYEDDLRDQWQSRAHRAAWRRMLRLAGDLAARGEVTVLSGEIHLATRAEMALPNGQILHQLVASGITHRPPPRAWARFLGRLAWLGEDPLPQSPIRIHPLPGQTERYVPERNSLTLRRQNGVWTACWDLEDSGQTPALVI